MMITPSLAEVKLAAAKAGLPEREAEKFWNYYESIGWRVGKCRMVSFANAIAGWKLRWEERSGPGSGTRQPVGGSYRTISDDAVRQINNFKP